MRDEGAIFGGEVSGHYYFHDFYNADSGTIPALLILEKLSIEDKRMSELLAPYHEKYFISGEINSEVADQDGEDAPRSRSATPTARVSHLDGVSVDYDDWHFNVRSSNTEPLLRLCLESLASREDMEARRDEVLGLISLVIHCLPIPTPFAVGRVNVYLVEDDPLDAGRRRAELRDVADDAGERAGRARAQDRGPRADRRHPPAHRPHRAGPDPGRPAPAPRSSRSSRSRRGWRSYGEGMEADDAFSEAIMARNGIPEDVRYALRSVSSAFRAWGAAATVTPTVREGDTIAFADRTWTVWHRPGHSPSDTVFHDAERRELIGGDHLIKHISSNPLISRPLDGGDPADRPQALAIYLDSLAKTREMDARRGAAGPRRGDPRARAADRGALPAARAPARASCWA